MDANALNLALAKWDGWTCRNCGNGPDKCTGCDFDDYPSYVIPSYTADLNAVHELEKKLTYELWADYTTCLARMAHGNHSEATFHMKYVCATALQRCEALARTLSLWDGGSESKSPQES